MIKYISAFFLIMLLPVFLNAQSTSNNSLHRIYFEGSRVGGHLYIYNSPDVKSLESSQYYGVGYGLHYEQQMGQKFRLSLGIMSLTEVQQFNTLVVHHDLYGDKVATATLNNNYFSYRMSFLLPVVTWGKTKTQIDLLAGGFVQLNHLMNTDIRGKYYYPDISTTEKFDLLNNDLLFRYVSNPEYGLLLDVRLRLKSIMIGFRQSLSAGSKISPENLKIYHTYGIKYGTSLVLGFVF